MSETDEEQGFNRGVKTQFGWGPKEWQAKRQFDVDPQPCNVDITITPKDYTYQCSSKSHARVGSLHRN